MKEQFEKWFEIQNQIELLKKEQENLNITEYLQRINFIFYEEYISFLEDNDIKIEPHKYAIINGLFDSFKIIKIDGNSALIRFYCKDQDREDSWEYWVGFDEEVSKKQLEIVLQETKRTYIQDREETFKQHKASLLYSLNQHQEEIEKIQKKIETMELNFKMKG